MISKPEYTVEVEKSISLRVKSTKYHIKDFVYILHKCFTCYPQLMSHKIPNVLMKIAVIKFGILLAFKAF